MKNNKITPSNTTSRVASASNESFNVRFCQDRIRNAQRHNRLRDLMVIKVTKMVEHGTNKEAILSKCRRQKDFDPDVKGTLGCLSPSEIEFIRTEVDLLLHIGEVSQASLARIAMQVRIMARNDGGGRKCEKMRSFTGSKDLPKGDVVSNECVLDCHVPQGDSKQSQSRECSGTTRSEHNHLGHSEKLNRTHSSAYSDTPWSTSALMPTNAVGRMNRRIMDPAVIAGKKEFYDNDGIDPWSLFVDKEKKDFQAEIITQRRANWKLEKDQRKVLDEQVMHRNKIKQALIEEEKHLAQEQAHQLLKYEDEVRKRNEEDIRKRKQEITLFVTQFEEKKRQREEEKRVHREEERRYADTIRDMIRIENEAAATEKRKHRDAIIKEQSFNIELRDVRRNRRNKEKEEDARLQEEFLEKLRKEEVSRELALAKLHERMTHQTNMAHEIEAKWYEKQRDDERKATQYNLEKSAEAFAEEFKRKGNAECERLKFRHGLKQQVLEKEQRKQKERDELLSYNEVVNREVAASQRSAAEEWLRVRRKIDQQRDTLDAHIQSKKRMGRLVMSGVERQLNSRLFEHLS